MIPVELKYYTLFFFTCSFLGWVMEVVCKLVKFHRFINRGYLIGPWCPIYGFGACAIGYLISPFAPSPWWVLILSMVLCGTLEYVTSWLMEKLFHARWWDYSHRRFNLNGRICAGTLIPFGIMGMVIVYLLQPLFFSLYGKLSDLWLNVSCIGLCAIILTDLTISSVVMSQIRGKAENVDGDSTESITQAVREKLFSESGLLRRVLDAFPYAKLYNTRLLKTLKEKNAQFFSDIRSKASTTVDEINQRSAEVKAASKAYHAKMKAETKEYKSARKEQTKAYKQQIKDDTEEYRQNIKRK